MVFEVRDKNFIVTGGASGMGALHVWNYLKQGAKGVAIIDIAVDQGNALVESANKTYPGKTIFVKCDISKEDEIQRAFAEVVDRFKHVHVIINNAGIMVDSPQMWRTACDVNWQGVVSFTLKGLEHMSKDEGGVGGVIVNIASVAALAKAPLLPIYYGSKSAVLHFCQCIATVPFLAQNGVRILCMCFGATDTPLLHNLASRLFTPKLEKTLMELYIAKDRFKAQKPESGVAAVDYAMKNGANGSIWLSANDKPAKDITAVIDAAYDSFAKVIEDNAK